MANVASNVALSFGLITASVSVQAALDPKTKTGNVMVCDAGHEPLQIRQPRVCDQCGEVPFQQLKKARPVDGGLVLLEKEDLAEAASDATAFKKRAGVTAHPAEQVQIQTSTGEKLYYLVPDKGHEQAYSTLRALVRNHPELAFVTQWTPRSALGQFQLIVHDDVLAFQERTEAGANLRPAPVVSAEENEALVGLAEQVLSLPGSVSEYDPATYRDHFEERIAALISTKDVVAAGKTETSSVAAPADLMAKLAAQVEAAKAAKKPAAKPRARRKVA